MSRAPKKRSGSLSSGSRLGVGLRNRRPSLAVDGAQPNSPTPSNVTGAIVAIIRGIAAAIFITVTLVVSGWLILGLTILPVVQVEGTPWVVRWAAWPEAMVPSGSVAMVSSSPRDSSMGARFSLIVSGGNNSIMEIVAGPGGEIKAGPDKQIFYNEIPTQWQFNDAIPPTKIGNQYLAVCILGPTCTPGVAELVPVERILGEVVGSLKLSPTLGPVPSTPTPPPPPSPLPNPLPTSTPSPPPSMSPSSSPSESQTADTGDEIQPGEGTE